MNVSKKNVIVVIIYYYYTLSLIIFWKKKCKCLIKLTLISCFINIKSECKKKLVIKFVINCNYCLGYLFEIISFILFYNFVL